MSGIILLDEARVQREREREAKTPHLEGPALCLACKHEWRAVIEIGDGTVLSKMECPACSAERGVFATHPQKDGGHWVCTCSNYLFAITPEGVYCPCCMQWQFGANVKPTG